MTEVVDISSRRNTEGKPFPSDTSAERSIIGGVLLRNEVLALIEDLEADDFFDTRNRILFQAIRNLQAAGEPVDVVTLEGEIERAGKLEAVGMDYLAACALEVPTVENVVTYKTTVQRAAINRRVIVQLGTIYERARNWPHDAAELVPEILGDIERITADARISTSVSRKVAYGSPFKEWIGDSEPSNDPAEIFDAHGLIVRSEPSLFLGDPKVGKTLVVTDLAIHLAAGRREWCGVPLYRRCKVLLLLREDSERTSRRRIWQMTRGAGIELWELEGWLEIDGITPLYFDDAKHLAQLRRQIGNYDIVLVDSLSTIHNGDENSVESMAPVMNQWRDLSLTTKVGVPIIHHFRKRSGEGDRSAPIGGSVLQRARGSSIIGATTRHAVGLSLGPEKSQVVIELESNHDIDLEPFVVQRSSGMDAHGRAWLTHKRVGSLRDAKLESDCAAIDPITLRVIRAGGYEGIGVRDLRDIVNHELGLARGRGTAGPKVDQSARRLADQGLVERIQGTKKWRATA
jgi:hypothetical protein